MHIYIYVFYKYIKQEEHITQNNYIESLSVFLNSILTKAYRQIATDTVAEASRHVPSHVAMAAKLYLSLCVKMTMFWATRNSRATRRVSHGIALCTTRLSYGTLILTQWVFWAIRRNSLTIAGGVAMTNFCVDWTMFCPAGTRFLTHSCTSWKLGVLRRSRLTPTTLISERCCHASITSRAGTSTQIMKSWRVGRLRTVGRPKTKIPKGYNNFTM